MAWPPSAGRRVPGRPAPRGGHFQECNDGVEKCVALGVRVGARRRGQIGQHVGQPGNQRKQGFDAAQSAQPTGADARHQRTQGFRERLIGRTEVLVATAVQHDRALLVGLPGPFAGQARLADTRFAGDQGGARTTAKRGLPGGQKPLELAPAPDERPGTDQHRGQARTLHRAHRLSAVGQPPRRFPVGARRHAPGGRGCAARASPGRRAQRRRAVNR